MGFPASFPLQQADLLINWLTGGSKDATWYAIGEAAYDVEGFVAKQLLLAFTDSEELRTTRSAVTAMSDRDQAELLKRLLETSAGPVAAHDFPWLSIWLVLRDLLQRAINQKGLE